jgi:hypothetical protein
MLGCLDRRLSRAQTRPTQRRKGTILSGSPRPRHPPFRIRALQHLGLDLADAFTRNRAWSETTTDLRYGQGRRDAVLKQIIEVCRQHDAALPANAKITHLLDLLRSDATVKPAVQLPSLDEWVAAEGMDADMWSEAGMLAEYKAAVGLDNVDAQEAAVGVKDPVAERVRVLNYQESILSVVPSAAVRLKA